MNPTRHTRIGLGAAAGLLSAAAGVGASLLVAVLAGGSPTPVTAVGSRVIDATPGAVKDWAVENLGTNDKPFLLAGISTVLALLAAATGLLAWRSRLAALALTGVLGLVGFASAAVDRTTLVSPLEKVLPSMAAVVVSIAMLWWFTRGWDTTGAGARPFTGKVRTLAGKGNKAPAGFDRRTFLAAALASGAVATVGYGTDKAFGDLGAMSRDSVTLPRATDVAAPLPAGAVLDVDGITPYLTSNKDFYRVDTALSVPQVNASSWSLRIHGLVDEELELSFQDLLDLPLVERRITLACVSNEVGGRYAGNASWLGVRTADLFRRLGVSPDADAVKSTSVDGMTIGTPLDALTDGRDSLIAVGMNGEPLPLTHGFPARLVVPGLYGYVSATKWVTNLEVTRFSDFDAYWTDRGFAEQAPIKTFSRIDVPKSFAQLDAGPNPVAGVAWAQDTGVSKVEVRVDGGAWQQARLATEDGIDTWRQWVYAWDAEPGSHDLEVRATDADGSTQTSRRVPPRPDGATGWHSVAVTVS